MCLYHCHSLLFLQCGMTAPFFLKEGMWAQKRLAGTCFDLQMLHPLLSVKKKKHRLPPPCLQIFSVVLEIFQSVIISPSAF